MLWWLTVAAACATPVFLVLSPVLSYSDQAISMHRNKSSAGFSLDIPLIMLIAALCRCERSLNLHASEARGFQPSSNTVLTAAYAQSVLLPGREIRRRPAHSGLRHDIHPGHPA